MKDFSISIETFTQNQNRLRVKNQTDVQKLAEISINKKLFRLAILEAGEELMIQLPDEIANVESYDVLEVEDEKDG